MISIIGSGKIGSAITFLLASNSIDDVVLVNRTKSKAMGEALDLSNTVPEGSSTKVWGTDDFTRIKNSNIIVISASTGIYTESRTETIKDQAEMMRSIIKKIKENSPSSKILMISNPLDVMTYLFQKEGGFDSKQVIGIAGSLDSSRFRFLLSQEFGVRQSEVSGALVMGEHGESMVPIFSKAKINQTPVLELLKQSQIEKISTATRDYWKTLRFYKSRSVFGISKHVYDVIKSILYDKEISIPASVLLDGQYGISDICMGVPVTINQDGLSKINEIELSNSELNSLKNSAKIIKSFINQC